MLNSNLKMSATAVAGVIFGIGAAIAADLPAPIYTKAPPIVAAVYDWSGFYIGGNGGWGGDRKCWDLTNNGGIALVPAIAVGCSRASSGVAGGQVGYRWQSRGFVFGVEAQGDWTNLKGSSVSLNNPLATNQSQVNALGLFTGQAGYAWNNVLLYVMGGAAVTADKYYGLGTVNGLVFDQASETRWGGTVGAGVEYGFAANWSAGLVYHHLFMGNVDNTFISNGGALSRIVRISQDVDIVAARISFHWGGPRN